MRRFCWGLSLALTLALFGCADLADRHQLQYQQPMAGFNMPQVWQFEGRIVIANDKESVTASIAWQHDTKQDLIDLSGPLAQGHVRIAVMSGRVTIDDGDQEQFIEGDPDEIVTARLGVEVPVAALKYWVLGLHDERMSVLAQDDGFVQSGWLVRYKAMQMVGGHQLPYKMSVEKNQTRLKLIVDQWNIL